MDTDQDQNLFSETFRLGERSKYRSQKFCLCTWHLVVRKTWAWVYLHLAVSLGQWAIFGRPKTHWAVGQPAGTLSHYDNGLGVNITVSNASTQKETKSEV